MIMRNFRFILLTLLGLSALRVSAAEAGKLLPSASGVIELVSPKFDEKAIKINDKIVKAWAVHRKILDAHSEQNAGGGLVWHEKMGVTRDELLYMLDKFRSPIFVKIHDAAVKVERKGDIIHLRVNPYGVHAANIASHLSYELKTGMMSLDKTRFLKPRFNDVTHPMEKVGRFVPGYEWALSRELSVTGFVHVGKIPNEPGKCLLNLSVIDNPGKPAFGSYRYNCP